MTNYFPQQPYQQPFRQFGLKVIPVASDAEINNSVTDFNGMPTYFHNQSTNEIVIKQFDVRTGITNIQKFIKSDGTGGEITEVKSDFDISKYDEKINVINDRLEGIERSIENMKGGKR